MKKTNSILTLLLTLSLSAFSQTNDVATLSKGRYIEVFENDTLQRIGSVMFNTVSNKIEYFIEESDSVVKQSTESSRWFSPDPMEAMYPNASPYNFCLNNPINAIDPDGRVVIFINGNHFGDGGTAQYWRQSIYKYETVSTGWNPYIGSTYSTTKTKVGEYAVDKEIMSQFGDNNARYYDGALGGWAGINSANPVAPFNRYIKGYIQGKTDAAAIIAGLQKNADGKITETIKIVSHSMGGIYSKGFVSALQKYIKENKLDVKIEIEVDFAPFQSTDALNKAEEGVSTYQASHSDDGVAGNGKATGSDQLNTTGDKVQEHSIFTFKNTIQQLGSKLREVRSGKTK